jgi:hypothetical protein
MVEEEFLGIGLVRGSELKWSSQHSPFYSFEMSHRVKNTGSPQE